MENRAAERTEREERYNIFFNTTPEVNTKYGFGSNQIIQAARTRDIIYYPFLGTPFLDMQPATVFENNNTYNLIITPNVTSCVISIGNRDGGYCFIDYPLVSLLKNFRIHKNLWLDMKCDFSNSYMRFTAVTLQPLPFIIPFVFQLYPE